MSVPNKATLRIGLRKPMHSTSGVLIRWAASVQFEGITVFTLHFTRYDMTEAGSACPLFASRTAKVTGIYILEFSNTERYVGQALNVVSRYAAHRRRFSDIVALHFAPCRAEQLNEAERATIRAQEIDFGLRNIMLTNLPGGTTDMEMTIAEEQAVVLPWEREKRPTAASTANTRRRRAWDLARRSDYPELRNTLARYVDQTIPDPIATAGQLWTLTALPSTSQRRGDCRLFTLNCGVLETFFLREVNGDDPAIIVAHFNVICDQAESKRIADHLGRINAAWETYFPGYRAEPDVTCIVVEGWPHIQQALACADLLDACYSLNVRLMRRGVSLFRKHHNAPFTADIIERIGQGPASA